MARKALDVATEKADIPALVATLDRLDDEATKEVLKAISGELTTQKKAQAMKNVKKIVQVADNEIKDWVVTAVGESYVEGMKIADGTIKKTSVQIGGELTVATVTVGQGFAIHRDAINALMADAYLDFGNGMNGLIKGVEHQFNETLKRQVRAKMIKGTATGQGMREIANEVKDVLGNQGFSVLVDRGGSKWSLQNYGKMLARTHIIKSGNEGVINRAAEFDTDIVQVSTHSGACKICVPFEGKTYSISGNSKTYDKLTQIPPFHPNCGHSMLLRPDLT